MMRSLIIALFFFFGPALLMFMLRNMVLLFLVWMKQRQQHRQEQVIDITPVEKGRAPRWFYIVVVLISLASAVVVFNTLQQTEVAQRQVYVPAHIDEHGRLVPGMYKTQ